MSQTFFSKLDDLEKSARLNQLGTSKGKITIWEKGSNLKHVLNVTGLFQETHELVLDTKVNLYSDGTWILCSFDLRGMSFFAQCRFKKNSDTDFRISIPGELFKSEKRSSYRLLTYPIYDIWAEFDFSDQAQDRKVVSLKSKTGHTDLFKNFLSIVDSKDGGDSSQKFKIRVQDLSTTGMAIHIGDLEYPFFEKDTVFKDVKLQLIDEDVVIPEAKIVYVVNYIADKTIKKYKVGVTFPNLPTNLDETLGAKINKLLRESDFNKNFEKFIK